MPFRHQIPKTWNYHSQKKYITTRENKSTINNFPLPSNKNNFKKSLPAINKQPTNRRLWAIPVSKLISLIHSFLKTPNENLRFPPIPNTPLQDHFSRPPTAPSIVRPWKFSAQSGSAYYSRTSVLNMFSSNCPHPLWYIPP